MDRAAGRTRSFALAGAVVVVALLGAPRVASSAPSAAARGTARPSRCVSDPIADALARWTDPLQHGPVTRADFAVEKVVDLDGDGVEERAVHAPFAGCAGMGGNCMQLVYLSGSGCAAYAGTYYVALESIRALPAAHGGVHDFRAFVQNGCAGLRGRALRFRWNGGFFDEVDAVACGCPDEDPRARRPSVCP